MELSKKDVVTLALADCGGTTDAVDTEDAAVAAHARAPGMFSWRKHRDQIDLDAVRVALRHEAEGQRPRVVGSVRSGWHLTPEGVSWVSSIPRETVQPSASRAPNPRRAETRHTGTEFARLRATHAFRAYAAGAPVSAREAAAVFRIDHYTSERDKVLKTQRMAELVQDDKELAIFVEAMAPIARTISRPEARERTAEEDASSRVLQSGDAQ